MAIPRQTDAMSMLHQLRQSLMLHPTVQCFAFGIYQEAVAPTMLLSIKGETLQEAQTLWWAEANNMLSLSVGVGPLHSHSPTPWELRMPVPIARTNHAMSLKQHSQA